RSPAASRPPRADASTSKIVPAAAVSSACASRRFQAPRWTNPASLNEHRPDLYAIFTRLLACFGHLWLSPPATCLLRLDVSSEFFLEDRWRRIVSNMNG